MWKEWLELQFEMPEWNLALGWYGDKVTHELLR